MLADGEGLGSGEVLEVLEGCAEGDASSLAVPLSLCDFASSDVVPWVLESVLGEVGGCGDSVGICVSDGEYEGSPVCSSPCSSWGARRSSPAADRGSALWRCVRASWH